MYCCTVRLSENRSARIHMFDLGGKTAQVRHCDVLLNCEAE